MLRRDIWHHAENRRHSQSNFLRTRPLMGFASSLQHHEVHIWQVDLGDAIWDGFLAVLCNTEREKASRYRATALQKRYTRCRSALRLILGRYVNQAAANLRFRYGEFGKPELIDHRLHFNVTHCGEHALVAVSLIEIGIDLEMISQINADLPGLIDLVCHPDEKAMLSRLPEAEKSVLFYRIWTQKEAYCKMRGIGLQQSLAALHFRATAKPLAFQVCDDQGGQGRATFVHNLNILDDYAVSISLAVGDPHMLMFQA
jgi:4'-phosphopantetheinyl transferase